MGKKCVAAHHKHDLTGLAISRNQLVPRPVGSFQTVPVKIQDHGDSTVFFRNIKIHEL